jgi:enoyl-CoA hydratase/carnithine racemase
MPDRSYEQFTQLEVTLTNGVFRIRLNDPEALNALSLTMMTELAEALHIVRADAAARVLVITGTGRGFCAGGNVKAMGEEEKQGEATAHPLQRPLWNTPSMSVDDRLQLHRQTGREIMLAIYKLDKPTIAAVNGLAAGAGCDLSLVCDMRFAARSARFSEIYVRRGIVPADGGMFWLPRLIGVARALELIYSGDWISAEDAARIGMVNRIVDDDALLDEVTAFAERIAQGPPLALEAIKYGVRRANLEGFEESLETSYGLCEYLLRTEDHLEAIAAHKEKRPPQFVGR